MIRSMLIARHGGMWLDSDAIVLHDLNWMFELLQTYEFVCFNNRGLLEEARRGLGSTAFCPDRTRRLCESGCTGSTPSSLVRNTDGRKSAPNFCTRPALLSATM
jgi:hypothetical protein